MARLAPRLERGFGVLATVEVCFMQLFPPNRAKYNISFYAIQKSTLLYD